MARMLVLAIVAAAAASSVAMALRPPVVPVFAQHEIKAKRNLLAFVPTFAPAGFHYYRWSFTRKPAAMHVLVRNRYGLVITLTASMQQGDCAAGHERSFQLDGNKVWWKERGSTADGTYVQESWRCVSSPVNEKPVRLAATIALPPTRFADTGIGQVAASGRWIR